MNNKHYTPELPSKDQLKDYIHNSTIPLTKRDLCTAFKIKGQERIALKDLLRELVDEGAIEKAGDKSYIAPNGLPPTSLIEIVGLDNDGELIAKPVQWYGKGDAPKIYLLNKFGGKGIPDVGSQMLAKLRKLSPLEYEGKILKDADVLGERIIGIFKTYKDGGYVYPTDKKDKEDYFVPPEFVDDLKNGDLVVAEEIPASSKYARSKKPVRIVEVLGQKDDPRLISLIAIHAHGIPTTFPEPALKEAEAMVEPDLSGGRVDIRHIPLVTIDGADARDFDDAVFAEPDTDPKNEGGWHLLVAIADVSFYVQPKKPLDRTAFERGNSTYFADRVVPMLPERLSNDLCSLRPKVNRACLACDLWIDKNGKLLSYKFFRGLMRSEARLTYEQVESAHLGQPDETTAPLIDRVVTPLYKVYSILKRAREIRGALEIDLPERKAIIDDKGNITAIQPRVRLDSHQLIEEFMILANVATALALEDKKAPCMYRVHDRPSFERLENTREFLKEMGYSLPKSDQLQPKNINDILKKSADQPDKELIHTLLLRTQSQAIYSPDNLGHFGLALEKYAHFTSPIRRYADLIVHRSLVRAYNLGVGGLSDDERDDLIEIAEHISQTERRSMLAERDVMDRFTAMYLSTNLGKEFKGRISGVTHFGLFVNLAESGADGIVPIRSLPRDYYIHDEKRHALVGREFGRTYRLAQTVIVRLLEADPMRGSTVFELVDSLDLDVFTATGARPIKREEGRKRFDANKKHKRRDRSKRSSKHSSKRDSKRK